MKIRDVLMEQTIDPATAKKFGALAELQRGEPEKAMLRVQFAMGGGVLNGVVEHGGDVIHRMNEFMAWGPDVENIERGREYVLIKTAKVLDALNHAYGFEREFKENIKTNAKYGKKNPEEFIRNLDHCLSQYAQAHDKLPTYNYPQALAKKAAVALGEKRFKEAAAYYDALHRLASSQEAYTRAMLVDKDKGTNP